MRRSIETSSGTARSATAVALCLLALTSWTAEPVSAQVALPSMSQPSPAPDGSEIAFVSGGDIWTVPAGGGQARLLITHEATEAAPRYSPDGSRLAFTSNRAGDNDIYVMVLASGEVTRITWGDGNEELDSWSRDGDWIYFADGRNDPGGHPDIWRIPSTGGTPMQVLADEYSPEFHAAVSPDGSRLAIAANARMAQGQWWRNGHSHIDESEIWIATAGDAPAYEQISPSGYKSVWPMWVDDQTLLYVSDFDTGNENFVVHALQGGRPAARTSFSDGRVLFPQITPDGTTVAFERNFGIWTFDVESGRTQQVPITLRGAVQRPVSEHLTLNSGFSDLSLSPDGMKVAFVARGDVFAASAKDGGNAARVTQTPEAESGVTWAPDSRRIAYSSRRGGPPKIYVYDFVTGEETALTTGDGDDVTPRFSPDGERLAYSRNGSEVRAIDLESGSDTRLTSASLARYPFVGPEPLVWSPDGDWLAYLALDDRMFTNVWLVPSAGGEARAVSGLANSFAGSIAWSPDGRTIYFDTQHRTQTGQVASVDLVPRTPVFQEDRFTALFDEPGDAAQVDSPSDGGVADDDVEEHPTPDFTDIRRRLALLPIGVDVGTLALSPDGKTIVFNASAEGRQNLYAFSVDREASGPPVTRQLTSSTGGKSTPQFTPDGSEVYYLESGRIRIARVSNGEARGLSVTAEMDVDFEDQKVAAFQEGWGYMRDHFYDDAFHGADWNGVRDTFEPYIRGAATRAEYSRLMNLMVGELNASHLGHGVGGNSGPTHGVLGLRFDRAEYESSGRLRVSEVLALGPAHVAGGVAVGDYVTTVDGTAMGPGVNLDAVLENRRGDKVEVSVASGGPTGPISTVSIQPVSIGNERQLEYRDWVESNRAYVEDVSDGRLGYVHMPSMSYESLLQLYTDLDAGNHDKEGVVVDMRFNNGGFVNAYALDAFARRGYLTMQTRGYPEANARSMLGQRSLELGTVLVVNQHTLSDGEDFTEGYRSLGLGQVVGEPTAGWIIFTWNLSLVDGSSFRMPRSRIRGSQGDDMELYPRQVDVEVVRPMGESYTGRDGQLDAAVRTLLGGG